MARDPDPLSVYNEKRDFARTREPRGQAVAGQGDAFVVQKHAASRLHYDFRLEWGGVLLSWAVTRGPSPLPSEKRLAVRTEDHPLDYGGFEGTIPKGEYGGGTVMLWDRGTWSAKGDVAEGLKKGRLKFTLSGERMQGGWALVRMRGASKRENWLLIKERDDLAQDSPDALTETFTTSVKTGRAMDAIENGEPARKPKATRSGHSGKRPAFAKPQLATLAATAPDGDDWQHETKFDGYRCLAALGKGGTRLYTRSGKDWTDRFGTLAQAFAALPCKSALIDGEVMAAKVKGSAFSSLQRALRDRGDLVYFAFDLLSLDGADLREQGQLARRERLDGLFAGQPADSPLRVSEHVTGHGADVFDRACKSGAEGIISKRIDAPYRGRRGQAWRKIKCTRRQEFVIVGSTPSDKRGRPFASILIATHQGGQLVYKGRVGTGFGADTMAALSKAMTTRKTPAATGVPADIARTAVWVRPDLVAEIDFTEFTDDGIVRHGSFLGLRHDKPAKAVQLEEPVHDMDSTGDDMKISGIAISSADRRVFPDAGCTKADVARHYDRVGERMVALAGHRPLSLFRCPSGIDGKCFFQKHDTGGMPASLGRIAIKESEGAADYLFVTRPDNLVAAAQMGTLEFHIWGARTDRIDRPDRLVFDLDPDEGMEWQTVRDAAFELRSDLKELGLATGAIVTGGKGVHVWLPLRRSREWDTVKLFAKTFAHVMEARHPTRYTASMSKAKRKGRIFIDWLRNDRGATAIAPYSLRARPGAPVAVPVTWDELGALKAPNLFTMADMKNRMQIECPAQALQSQPQSLSNAVIDRLGQQADG